MKYLALNTVALFVVLLLAALTANTGCKKNKVFKEHTVKKQSDAASVTVSTTLVEHWDDYVEALSPNFTLKDGDAALAKVVPQTMALEDKIWRSFAGKLSVSASLTDDAASEAAVEHPELRELPGLTDEQRQVGQDPMLEYLAATALYQEVQLLNRYINDAALRHDYVPYVVRLQLGVTPYARNMPYDVFTTLAFFLKPQRPEMSEQDAKTEESEQAERSATSGHAELTSLSRSKPDDARYNVDQKDVRGEHVLVAPLLVTDNLEGALKSQAMNTVRDLTLALSIMMKKVNVSGGLATYAEELNAVLGTDLNSLLTVGQVNDNAILVRLGSARQATAGYSMLPRTHNVTMLVLVGKPSQDAQGQPSRDARVDDARDDRTLSVISRTELRHARKGDLLKLSNPKCEWKDFKKKLKKHSKYVYPESREWAEYCYEGLTWHQLIDYYDWAANADFDGFEDALYDACKSMSASTRLWMEVIELARSGPYAQASLDLPEPKQPQLPQAQTVVLRDDEKAGTTTIVLQGGQDLNKGDLFATLEPATLPKPSTKSKPPKAQATPAEPTQKRKVKMAAEKIEVGPGARGYVKLTFPSLKSTAFPTIDQETVSGKLTLGIMEDSRWKDDATAECRPALEALSIGTERSRTHDHADCREYTDLSHTLVKESKPLFEMKSGTRVLRADPRGNGKFVLSLSVGKTQATDVTVQVAVTGADMAIETTDGEAVTVHASTFAATLNKGDAHRKQDFVVRLRNLSASSPVTISAKQIDGSEKKIGVEHTPLILAVETAPIRKAYGVAPAR